MKKLVVTRSFILLTIAMSMLFGLLSVSYASEDGDSKKKGDSIVGYLNEDEDTGIFDAQTKTVKKLGVSLVGFLILCLDTIAVIAAIVMGIMLLFGLGDPQTHQKLKKWVVGIVIALILGNGAVTFVDRLTNLSLTIW